MLIFLIYLVNSQYIQDGIQILENRMQLSIDKYLVYSNCPANLNSFCHKRIPSISIQEQETLNVIQNQVQQVLEQLEPEQNKHQYYNKIINQLFQEIVLYDQNEEFLSFTFKFTQFNQKKELQLIQEKYYIDSLNRSAILMDNNNISLQEYNNTLFMKFQDLYIPSKNKILNHQFGSINILYPPDSFNIRTADKNGCIYFTKPIYLTQFYALSYEVNSIISIGYNNQTIKMISIPVKNKWVLVFGPTGQYINNITISKQTHIDSLIIKVQKQPFTIQQIKIIVIERILDRYYLLNSESLLNYLSIEDESQEDDQIYYQTIDIFLEFLEKVLGRINQFKKYKQFESLNSEQIIDILQDIEDEMQKNEILKFKNLFQNFMVEKYSENDIIQMYEQLMQINEELKDNNID
ncbi:unnamed protein product [Paramecium primaurelia]|uniref:Uncharacterized protein n=1 Tax=Paramecium primaurelia TaxID=5886 RepID=A0A8S1MBF8_PARPR|nr:unnamed protein product [Paramecium primaurelia]